jgi:hypothetical protein
MHRGAVRADVDDVGEHAGADPRGQPAGDFLAVGGGGHQHRSRAGRLDQLLQHVDERRDQVVLSVGGLGDVDLGRTGGLEVLNQRRGGAGGTDHDGRGLTQRAGCGDELGGDLLHRALGVLDEHEYFSHGSSLSRSLFSTSW